MKSRQVISLLLAGQMLGAPLAQAVSLSQPEEARRNYPRIQLQDKARTKTVAESAVKGKVVAEATPTTTPEAAPAATPEVTTEATPEAAPAATPEVTLEAAPEAAPAATPEVMPAAIPEAAPAATPEMTPEATPEVTLVPALIETPASVAKPALEGAFFAARDGGEVPERYPLNMGYIGFGYEEHHADIPAADNAVKEAGKYWVDQIDNEEIYEYAKYAVEKPLEYPNRLESAYFNGDLANEEEPLDWVADEQGEYSVEGLHFFEFDWDHYVWLYHPFTEIESWLGRLPDYKFDNWYVSSQAPSLVTTINDGSESIQYLWNYSIDITNTYELRDGNNYTITVERTATKVPLSASEGDFPLDKDSLTQEEMDRLRDTILDYTKHQELLTTEFYYSDGKDPDDHAVGEVDLPIIAHWKLSDDARLVASAPYNAAKNIGKKETATASTSLDIVSNGERLTGEGSDLLDRLFADDSYQQSIELDYENGGTYYSYVTSDVDAISPILYAMEPFLTEERGGDEPGVSIQVRQAGNSDTAVYNRNNGLCRDFLNGSQTLADGTVLLYNNAEFPLRSKWTVANDVADPEEGSAEGETAPGTIPLSRSCGTSEEDRYNEIKIIVTAPDGKSQKTYTFLIQRLNDPRVEQNPGNTPFGMIARESTDGGSPWAKMVATMIARNPTLPALTVADMLEVVQNRFLYGNSDHDGFSLTQTDGAFTGKAYSFNGVRTADQSKYNPYFPQDDASNNNGLYEAGFVYTPAAWGADTGNIDLDKTAIVVYQDSSFVDPGFTVYDGQGLPVVVDPSAGNVKRNVTLRVSAEKLLLSDISNGGELRYYADGTMEKATDADNALLWNEAFQAVKDPQGKDQIDLRNIHVIPGVYTIEYQFKDPLAGIFDSSTEDQFADTQADFRATFSRTMVVLPVLGDLDMDGAVTAADAETLSRIIEDEQNGKDTITSMYKYRVCDVNNDGFVNEDDVAAILAGLNPQFERNRLCQSYFYVPLPTGLSEREEAAWHAVNLWDETTSSAGPGKGTISLEYLGLHDETKYPDAASLNNIANKDEEGNLVALKEGDIFWVGVKVDLTNVDESAAIRQGIALLSLSIAYDNTRLEPAVLREDDDTHILWRRTLHDYNIGDSTGNDTYLWPTTYYLLVSGTQEAKKYSDHYSRSTPKEDQWGSSENISELTVTLKNGSGARRVLEGEEYLLRVPFKLRQAPIDGSYLEALELSLSMQDLNLFADDETSESKTYTAAWSGQDVIFGSATENLANELTYINGSARKIPLAADVTTNYIDIHMTYGEYFERNDLMLFGTDEEYLNGRLPEGLTYDGATLISGTPREVGTFPFENQQAGDKTRYRIIIDKAELTLTAVPVERYYGEPDGAFDYTYNKEDIKPIDRPDSEFYAPSSGFQWDGSSADLEKLGGVSYQAPKLTTNAEQGSPANGDYTITIADDPDGSGMTNYRFVYATMAADGTVSLPQEGEPATSVLTIRKRPLIIDSLTDEGMAEVTLRDESAQRVFLAETSYQNEPVGTETPEPLKGFVPAALDSTVYAGYADRLTGSAVYGEDKVGVSFTARLTWENDPTQGDDAPPYYNMDGKLSKKKEADISDMKLLTDLEQYPDNANYELIQLVTKTANATITANSIDHIDVEEWDGLDKEYFSGDKVSFIPMKVNVYYELDGKVDSVQYKDDSSFDNWQVNSRFGPVVLTWVSLEDWYDVDNKKPLPKEQQNAHINDPAHRLVGDQELQYSTHNAKYLCVSVTNGGNPVSWFSEKPFTVLKQPLTLKAKDLSVYYGEFKTEMLGFTYDPKDLAKSDYDALSAYLGHEPTGASEELEGLPGYKPPKLGALEAAKGSVNARVVTADTPVHLMGSVVQSYPVYIENELDGNNQVISGARDYSFVFENSDISIEGEGGEKEVSTSFGKSSLTIWPRPIYVQDVTVGELSRVFVYDDTTSNKLEKMYYADEDGSYVATSVTLLGQNEAATTDEENADTFIARTPVITDTNPDAHYYTLGVIGGTQLRAAVPETLPIHQKLDGTLDKVEITYTATYQVDNTSAAPPVTPYFNLTQSTEMRDIDVSMLRLAPAVDSGENKNDNRNYILVYNEQVYANRGIPVEHTGDTAAVKMRPLHEVKVATWPDAGNLEYTYGQTLDLTGMSLELIYEGEGSNVDPAQVESRFLYYSAGSGGVDSFARQGLEVYWQMSDQLDFTQELTPEKLAQYLDDGALERTLPEGAAGRYPDVVKTGKYLVVAGRRNEDHAMVWTGSDISFTIHKKTIPMTAQGVNRYYGETCKTYTGTFPISALSQPDQAALRAAGAIMPGTTTVELRMNVDTRNSTDEKEVSESAVGSILHLLNEKYLPAGTQTDLGFRFTTPGTPKASRGTYPITVEATGTSNLANYVFDNSEASASLRVFRRPIVIEKINAAPVSTIYYNTIETNFPGAMVTQVGQSPDGDGFTAKLPALEADGTYRRGVHGWDGEDEEFIRAVEEDGMSSSLPMSGTAIVGDDELELSMTAVFRPSAERDVKELSQFPAGVNFVSEPITIQDMVLSGGDSDNYFIVYEDNWSKSARSPADVNAIGYLDKRNIESIQMKQVPRMSYQYGDGANGQLNLRDLQLTVIYEQIPGEAVGAPETLSYSSLSGRLRVNYYPDPVVSVPTNQMEYDAIVSRYPASHGDHLTIAPSHEERFSDGQGNYIGHDGKYLILTARTDQYVDNLAKPILVSEKGEPIPIHVEPMDLAYTLWANDRTYAEEQYPTRRATGGTITLKDPYVTTQTIRVTGEYGQTTTKSVNDRDLIYVAADKSYSDEELKQYLNAEDLSLEEAYTFTVDGTEQTGRMAFNFFDENVMYYEGAHADAENLVAPEDWQAYWDSLDHDPLTADSQRWDTYEEGVVAPMPVLVSGLMLMGPDAANYTLDPSVGYAATSENDPHGILTGRVDNANPLAQNTDNTEKSSVPYATLYKADQFIESAEVPQVTVDVHTNAVHLSYETPFPTQDSGDQFRGEFHYEYNLEYFQDGSEGPSLWGAWSDYSFFGGEKMTIEALPEGYEPPKDADEATTSVVKGQIYQWEAEDETFGQREPLDRDAVYWGTVRLAATRNYNASEPKRSYSEELGEEQREKALRDATFVTETVLGWANENFMETAPAEPVLAPADAVKTYKQSFKLISVEETKINEEETSVKHLEAVWFTDTQQYKDSKALDAVLRNKVPVRYYGYYWDENYSASLTFSGLDGLDLSKDIFAEIDVKLPDGSTAKERIQVNVGDDAFKRDSAVVYVKTKSGNSDSVLPSGLGFGGGGSTGEALQEKLNFVLGDKPYKLEVKVKPASAMLEGLWWNTSDPNVVQVTTGGELIFVGVGTAVVTATTRRTGKTATVTIHVSDPEGLSQGVGTGWKTSLELAHREENRFNFYYDKAFFRLDDDYEFHPEWEMDRGELASVLFLFYLTSEEWKPGKATFPDMTGTEDYYKAVEILHQQGILQGMPDGTFSAGCTATRAEVATILCRMMGLEPLALEGGRGIFLDCGYGKHWANNYINALAEAGVVLGTGDNLFTPERPITRAELAAMLGRVLLSGVSYGEDRIIPSDVTAEHWAYSLILRAINSVVPRS